MTLTITFIIGLALGTVTTTAIALYHTFKLNLALRATLHTVIKSLYDNDYMSPGEQLDAYNDFNSHAQTFNNESLLARIYVYMCKALPSRDNIGGNIDSYTEDFRKIMHEKVSLHTLIDWVRQAKTVEVPNYE